MSFGLDSRTSLAARAKGRNLHADERRGAMTDGHFYVLSGVERLDMLRTVVYRENTVWSVLPIPFSHS
jgi:hypothetical protein